MIAWICEDLFDKESSPNLASNIERIHAKFGDDTYGIM